MPSKADRVAFDKWVKRYHRDWSELEYCTARVSWLAACRYKVRKTKPPCPARPAPVE